MLGERVARAALVFCLKATGQYMDESKLRPRALARMAVRHDKMLGTLKNAPTKLSTVRVSEIVSKFGDLACDIVSDRDGTIMYIRTPFIKDGIPVWEERNPAN